MLILHNLIRYAYTRSRSSLWLATCEGLLRLSLLLLLNLAGPWLPDWHALQTPGRLPGAAADGARRPDARPIASSPRSGRTR